ncbi:hypothetical protein ACKWTF_008432 [Chironomus riparius]
MKAFLGQILLVYILWICQAYCDTACSIQNEYIEDFYNKGSLWARKFRDSWGKFPSGIFSGNHFDFGHFDQCLYFKHYSEDVSEIQGQYCLLMFPYDMKKQEVDISPRFAPQPYSSKINIGIGICIPRTCKDDEINVVANSTLMTLTNISLPTSYQPDLFCSVKRDNFMLNPLQISAIVIFSVLIILIILSTGYEVTSNLLNRKKSPLFSSFSLYSNSKGIMTMKASSSKEMLFLHGIRSLAIIWIVVCHTYTNFWQVPVFNSQQYFEWIRQISAMFILSGVMGVDTFFLMSSMLLTMSVFRELDKTNRINLPLLYIKRFIRITIPLAAALLFILTFLYYLSDGPIWSLSIKSTTLNFCRDYWWSTLLYIGNHVNPGELCFGHSWYLQVDMQLYFLSPIILYPLWRFRKHLKVIVSLIFLIASSSIIYMYLIFYLNGFRVTLLDEQGIRRDQLTYYATQARIDSWMMGILTGYILYILEGKNIKFSRTFLTTAWILCLTGILGVIIGQYPLQQTSYTENSIHADASYSAFRRISWCLSVSWIIIACHQNRGGIVKKFLSLSIWLPISKLSYCIYLVHLPIQLVFLSSIRVPQYFTDFRALHNFLGDFGLAVIVAFVWALMFEYPTMRLIKFFLDKRSAN